MKDEEMARDYANSYATPDLEGSFRAYMFEASKDGFLAGLKAGRQDEQLTKAKDIIRTFLNMPMPNNEEVFADVGIFLTKAEQFLKEV